ncbi:TPA: hypothetical protein MG739_25100 [Klebsiella pneumoniae]|nr:MULTISPECIES: hypothetical protein [Klebsiella]MBC4425502.1 hypothetical protein [Klebsiella variicola]MBK2797277.1 hypothetical protein [Klebsiella pneumoniae]MCC4959746.1 hypothetical protein [Klebsiella pneumoniae]OUY91597.1 hypothetical protein BLL04_19675 [Klebsiella variicola]UMU52066.1 hypothetical protein HZT23_27370 [Klebsiella quasipneumoniae]
MILKAMYSESFANIIQYVYVKDSTCYCAITGQELSLEIIDSIFRRYPDLQLLDADEAEKLRDLSLMTQWKEISKDRFDDMLNMLYPADWKGGALSDHETFKYAEGYTNHISYIFARIKNRYFECRSDRNKSHETIIHELQDYL